MECSVSDCDKLAKHVGLCLGHYKRFNRYGDPLAGGISHHKNPDDAFKERTCENDLTGCIEWTGSSDARGYGQMRINRKAVKAHRYAWERINGPIENGLLIRHKCDNPKCVNINHLELGTHKDNVDDMDKRGRRVNNQPKGSDCHASKISESDVRKIIVDPRRQVDIAQDYGISQAVVSKIKLRQAWRHVK